MKRLPKIAFLAWLAVASVQAAPYTTPNTGVRWTMDSLVVYSGGTVTGGGGTYTVTDEVIVAASDRLTIAAGTTVNHSSGTAVGLTVRGVVRAEGTVSLPVRFLGSGSPASYRGIRVEDTAVDSLTVFRSCHVFDATEGIHCLNASPLIEDSWFKGNGSNGVRCFTASPVVRNCLFELNSRNAVTVNLGSSPVIEGCTFSNNNTENTSPRNQINVGPQGANNPVIRNNTIQNGPYFRTGAISLTALNGASCAAIVEGNTIRNNSFGILSQGIDMTPRIRYNLIENNTINPDPMVSGSGISVQVGGPTNAPVITGNIIRGNLWGVTIVSSSGFANSPQPSLGNLNNADTSDDGWNIFSGNGNGGVIYQLFNNGNANILAQNNYWGSADSATVERWITHRADSIVYGEVIYRPYGDRGFGAPQWFQVAQRGSDSVRLSWRYAGQPAGMVRVMAGADTSTLQSMALLASRETSYVMPAPYGVPRWYGMSSLNRFGESDTTTARFTVRDIFPPAIPAGLTVQLAGIRPPRGGVFLVSWRRNGEPDLRSYRLHRAIRDSSVRVLLATVLAPDTSYRDSTVGCDTTYYYWVSAQDTAGNEGASAVRQYGWPCPLAVETDAEEPREFALRVPFPNPFNPSTEIRYELPEPARVSLTVYDVLGRAVETLVEEKKEAGYHAVHWNAASRSSGVYLARFTATTATGTVALQRTMKLVLAK